MSPNPLPVEKPRFLAGLVGSGIARSRSPWLHEREGDAQGVRLIYSLYDLPQSTGPAGLAQLLRSAAAMAFAGLNVTHPFKQSVIPLLDDVDSEALAIGAVNTVRFSAGRTTGFNTDYLGFAETLKRGLADERKDKVVQLGAGGAGFATAHALLQQGTAELVLCEIDAARAEALCGRLRAAFPSQQVTLSSDPLAALEGADGLVNATPVGMTGHPGMPVPESAIRPPLWVADIVYFPLETQLLRVARSAGCKSVNGVQMVVFQAAAAFDLYTGLVADRERMLLGAIEHWTEPGTKRDS